jgi:hypothetical protein
MKKTVLLALAATFLSLTQALAQQVPTTTQRLMDRLETAAGRPATGPFRRTQALIQRYPGGTWTSNRREIYSNFTPLQSKPQLTQLDSLNGTTVLPLRQFRRRYNGREQVLTDTTMAWSNLRRYIPIQVKTYTYNAQDSLATEVQQDLRGSVLVPYDRLTYSYDITSRRLTQIQYESYDRGAWSGYGRDQYTYDAQGRLSQIDLLASILSGPYTPFSRTIFTYNAQGRLESTVIQFSNSMGGFDNLLQTIRTYVAGRLLRTQVNQWRNGAWQPSNQYQLFYDTDGNVETEILQRYGNSVYNNFERFVYSYQNTLATSAARLRAGLSVVPNPSHGGAEVRFALPKATAATVEVLDALGRSVAELPVPSASIAAQRVSLAPLGLRAGLYVVRLRVPGQSQQVKLVVE